MALSAAEKLAIKRSLIFYGAYLNKAEGYRNVPSNDDLEGAFQDADVGGSSYATKRADMEAALDGVISPPFSANIISKIEEEA